MMQNCEQLLLALLTKDVHRSDLKGLVILWNDAKTISRVKFSPSEDKMVSKAAIRLIATIEELQKCPACAVFSVQQSHEL